MVGLKSLFCDGAVSTRMTDNLNSVGENTDFNRLADIITLMINCIAKTFFDCCVWVIEKTIGFCFVRKFNYLFLNHTVLDILQCFTKLLMQRSPKGIFDNPVSPQTLRKLNNINLGIGEKTFRC